jgi:hypothetical protein
MYAVPTHYRRSSTPVCFIKINIPAEISPAGPARWEQGTVGANHHSPIETGVDRPLIPAQGCHPRGAPSLVGRQGTGIQVFSPPKAPRCTGEGRQRAEDRGRRRQAAGKGSCRRHSPKSSIMNPCRAAALGAQNNRPPTTVNWYLTADERRCPCRRGGQRMTGRRL